MRATGAPPGVVRMGPRYGSRATPRAIGGPLAPVSQGPSRSLAVHRMPRSGRSGATIGRIPKLIVRVRFSSPALITLVQVGTLVPPLSLALEIFAGPPHGIGVPLLPSLLLSACWGQR